MTRREAIDKGYELCGKADMEWQNYRRIEDLEEEDFDGEEWVVVTNESISPTIDAETIARVLAEEMEINWSDSTGDDTEQVYNTLIAMKPSFVNIAGIINGKLKHIKSHKCTNIILQP